MSYISVKSFAQLSSLSERTIRRMISNGELEMVVNKGKKVTLIASHELNKHCLSALSVEELALLMEADKGDPVAQSEVAVLFLEYSKPELAVYWLKLAANQNHADAMQLLSACYAKGLGVVKEGHLAIMWLAKAAALGHPVAKEQMAEMVVYLLNQTG